MEQLVAELADTETAPEFDAASLERPVELTIIDIADGSGTAAEPTSTVEVHYVGQGMNTGTEFDSSWRRNRTTSFGLNQVIEGWSKGLVGMKPGGRRLLLIPAEMAYGSNPPPGSGIERNEPLAFVVDLISVS